jgi:hypothetical protein
MQGHKRSELRAQTVKLLLARFGGKPPSFWHDVDQLALNITEMLIPLVNSLRPTYNGSWYSLAQIHIEIHYLVASAAWYSVQTRKSPSILEMFWPKPGEEWGVDKMQVSPEVLHRSKQHSKANLDGHKSAAACRVKIAVCPQITLYAKDRYHTVSKDQHKVYSILRPRVALYYGLKNGKLDQASDQPLKDFISKGERKRRIYSYARIIRLLIVFGLIFYFGFRIRTLWKYLSSSHVRHTGRVIESYLV